MWRGRAVHHLVVAFVVFADMAFMRFECFFERVGGLAFAFEIGGMVILG